MKEKLIAFIKWYVDYVYFYLRYGIKSEPADSQIWSALNGSSISIIPATPEERLTNRYILEFPEMFPIGILEDTDASDNETDKPEIKSANPVIVVRDWLDERRSVNRDRLSSKDNTDNSPRSD